MVGEKVRQVNSFPRETALTSQPPFLYVPASFDPAACLGGSLWRRADLARLFVSRIIWMTATGRADDDGWVRVKRAYVEPFFPNRRTYDTVRKSLIGSGDVECDGDYRIGDHALGYRLGPSLRDCPIVRVPVTDPRLADKLSRAADERDRSLRPIHRTIEGHLASLTVEATAARAWIAGAGLTRGANDCARYSVDLLEGGERRVKVGPLGRLYSPLSSSRRGLRPFMRLAGGPMVGVDVSCCQPLLVVPTIMGLDPRGSLPADVRDYLEVVEAGQLYEILLAEAGIGPEGRDPMKQRVLTYLFGPAAWRGIVAEVFDRRWPTVAGAIREAKAGGHERVARVLQMAEVRVMLDGAATILAAEHPGVRFVTLHDGIFVNPDHAGIAHEAIRRGFATVGIRPSVKVQAA